MLTFKTCGVVKSATLIALALFMILATSCSPRHTIILTPDPDGHVGKAIIMTGGGNQILDNPYGMTTVSSGSLPPAAVTIASQEFIALTFADAMAIQPPPAEKFIIYFHTNTTNMVSESKKTMTAIFEAIQHRKPILISISGHTDASGSDQLNEILARNRSHSISELLVQKGIDTSRLTVTSHGKGNQLVITPNGVSEPRNRRVEVIVR